MRRSIQRNENQTETIARKRAQVNRRNLRRFKTRNRQEEQS